MANDEKQSSPITFPIDLALSGGGTRATGFHLGVLSMLDEIKLGRPEAGEEKPSLLSRLRAFSTVSGGTFIGARYVLSLVQGAPFKRFFEEFYNEQKNLEIVKQGLDYLSKSKASVPSGRHNLIISMAQVYADTFLKKSDGKPALFGDVLDHVDSPETVLQEVIFNTTEFRTGSSFRFQTIKLPSGNDCMPLARETTRNVRLADIVAASSCIPAGFEPIVFPYDFVWSDLNAFAGVCKGGCFVDPGVPLMDGGIYDNLGASTLMTFEELEDEQQKELGAVIFSDVFQESKTLYEYPEGIKKGRFPFLKMTLGGLKWMLRAIIALCAMTLVVLVVTYIKVRAASAHQFWHLFLYLIPSLLAVSTAGVLLWVRFRMRSFKKMVQKEVPQIDDRVIDGLQWSSIGHLVNMIILRMTSLVALTSSVFMSRVRQLTYDIIEGKDQYTDKRINCLIYQLHTGHPFDSRLERLGLPKVSGSPLERVVNMAAEMPTLMWFDKGKDYQLPCLVASGQATLCYNLLRHVINLHVKEHGAARLWRSDGSQFRNDLPNDLQLLWDPLVAKWKELVNDPYAILKRNLPGYSFEEPPASAPREA